jgi:hypothetical protein
MSDEIPAEDLGSPDQPVVSPRAPRPRWQSIALGAGAVLLGLAVVVGGALVAGGLGLVGTPGASASGQPSVVGSSSIAPSSAASSSPSTTAASPTPAATPRAVNAAFSIFPATLPTDLPQITCSGSIGASDPVALVGLRPTDPTVQQPEVLRDYADLANPRTVCTFDSFLVVQLIDARHVVTGGGGNGRLAVVDVPDGRFQWFQLPSSAVSSSELIAVSPQLDEIVWLKNGPYDDIGTISQREIHIATEAGDTTVATLPDEPTGFCGYPPDYSNRGAFSRTGEHVYVLDQPRFAVTPEGTLGEVAATYSLRVFAGTTLVYSVVPPSGGWLNGGHPAYPVWSPTSETLYYRQGNDVWRWTPDGGASRFLTGVPWFNSTISPDGKHLAYALNGDTIDAPATAYLADLPVPGQPLSIGPALQGPVFLNNRQVWLMTLGANYGCAGGEKPKPVIYNIGDHSTASSIIEGVRLVWPATSSNY